MNILLTSAGKRVSLVRYLQRALKSRYPEAKVLTTDMDPEMAPACYVSDGGFKAPRVTAPEYPKYLLQLCIDNDVKMVIPTIDTELYVLTDLKADFKKKGIDVVVSDRPFIEVCRDKRNTGDFFKIHGIKVPKPMDKNNPVFPLFAKPYDGSLSSNVHYIHNSFELTGEILYDPKLIFMECIDKKVYKEYSVDIYYGRDNHAKCIIPRERIAIRAGEINKGRTAKNALVKYVQEHLGYISGCVGCICGQFFLNPKNNDIIGIEINPRFGGGFPLSCEAGGDYTDYLVREYFLGESIEYTDSWTDNKLMLRYDDAIYV